MRTQLGDLRQLIREAYKAESYKPQLEAIIKRHAAPHVYLRFDDRESFSKARSFRLDMNPNDHTNHAGLWTYMIEPGSEFLHDGTFGSSSRWVTILTVKDPRRLVRSDRYSQDNLQQDVMQLAEWVGEERVAAALQAHEYRKQKYLQDLGDVTDVDPETLELMRSELQTPSTPFEKLDSLATWFNLGKGADLRNRQRQFYMKLGYSGIEDPNGVIDTSGWTAVHFDPKNVKVIKRYRLRDAFDPEEHDREEEEYWRTRRIPDDFDPSRPENDPGDPSHEPGFYYTDTGDRKPDPRARD